MFAVHILTTLRNIAQNSVPTHHCCRRHHHHCCCRCHHRPHRRSHHHCRWMSVIM